MNLMINKKIRGITAGLKCFLKVLGYPDATVRVLFAANSEPLAIITFTGTPAHLRSRLENLSFVKDTKHKFRFRKH